MAEYRFVAVQGSSALGELSALDKRIDFRLDRPSTVGFRLNAESLLADTVNELSTDILVYRDGQKMARFALVSSRDAIDDSSHYIEFTGVDYRGRLESRLVLTTQTFTADDDVDIAWQAIDDAQALTNGGMGITRGVRPAGLPLTGEFPAGISVSGAIDLVANVDDGFDWDVDADLRFNIFRPRGTAKDRVLDYGGLVSQVDREFLFGDFANVIRASGDDTVASVTVGTGSAQLGRWESQVGFSNVNNSTLLTGLAVDALNRSGRAVSYRVRLRSSEGIQRWGGMSDIGLGDSVRLVVKLNRLDVNEIQRVQEISVSVSDDGAEDVTFTLDGPRRTFSERIGDVYQRLSELERQD
jgi:hypothetical protein